MAEQKPKIISRAEWQAKRRRGGAQIVAPRQRKRVGVHYSTGQELGRDDCAAWVRQIQLHHQLSNGWSDIGYNFLVCKHGDIFEGRGWDLAGAHCPGRNIDSIGICFLGNDDPNVLDVTVEAKLAIRFLIDEFERKFGKPEEIFPHRKYKATLCPGQELSDWIEAGLPID